MHSSLPDAFLSFLCDVLLFIVWLGRMLEGRNGFDEMMSDCHIPSRCRSLLLLYNSLTVYNSGMYSICQSSVWLPLFSLFFIFPKREAISGWSLFCVQVWRSPVSLLLDERVMQSSCSDAVQNRMLSNYSALLSSLFSTRYVFFLFEKYRVYFSISMNTGSWLFNMCILSLSIDVKCCGIRSRVC